MEWLGLNEVKPEDIINPTNLPEANASCKITFYFAVYISEAANEEDEEEIRVFAVAK
jgi:hypothetical protein